MYFFLFDSTYDKNITYYPKLSTPKNSPEKNQQVS